MILRRIFGAFLSCGVLWLVTGAGAIQKTAEKTAAPQPDRNSGAELYKRFCAVCHGNDGKGNGPPPRLSRFKEAPPDLTTLALRHDGKFPDAYVKDVLGSGAKLPDHGSAEMPVWGTAFKAMKGSGEADVTLRITNLTNYIKSIQAKE
ncbi:MAG TPA: c-type cytochrome [Candidatus Acidoferrum sp.]|nr:c-type cytochrome [Candidatus Acidoferrum sp.]